MIADFSQVDAISMRIAGAPAEVAAAARRITQKVCADTKRDGQAFCPVDTGNLRSSIGYETHSGGTSVWGEVGPSASYGAHVEYGTSRMAPHAYMGPAFDRHAGEYVDAMVKIGAVGL